VPKKEVRGNSYETIPWSEINAASKRAQRARTERLAASAARFARLRRHRRASQTRRAVRAARVPRAFSRFMFPCSDGSHLLLDRRPEPAARPLEQGIEGCGAAPVASRIPSARRFSELPDCLTWEVTLPDPPGQREAGPPLDEGGRVFAWGAAASLPGAAISVFAH